MRSSQGNTAVVRPLNSIVRRQMNIDEVLRIFCTNFVQPDFRERFLHEAVKKPTRLRSRICHEISDVFLPQYRGGRIQFSPDAACITFVGTRLQPSTWAEEMQKVATIGGGGRLIIDASGRGFYADSEGFPPPDVYAGQA
jgi:hypothetical protein